MLLQKRDGAIITQSARSSAELLSQEQKSHQKTRATLTTREEFLAIVSHDLRNPLNNISLAAQNLLEDPKDIKELAASINRSAGEMLRLIEDLLDIERIAVGKLTLHIEQHDVSEIIKQSVEQLHGAAVFQGNNPGSRASRRVWLRGMRPEPRHAGVVKSDWKRD